MWLGFVGIIAVLGIINFVSGLGQDPGSIGVTLVGFIINVISAVVGWMMLRGALLTADGRKPDQLFCHPGNVF